MYCINERFLAGCSFDKAYPNPCESPAEPSAKLQAAQKQPTAEGSATLVEGLRDFNKEQQMKLRSIASKAGLLNVLVENSLIGRGIRTMDSALLDASADISSRDQEKLVIYLLIGIVVVTILVTIVMILVMISSNSTRQRSKTSRAQRAVLDQLSSTQLPRHAGVHEKIVDHSQAVKRISNHYLSNQHQSRLRPHQLAGVISTTAHHHQHHSKSRSSGKPFAGTAAGVVMNKGRVYRDDIDNSVL